MPDDDQQMNESEFNRARFFTPANEMAALHAQNQAARAATAARRPRGRRSDVGVRALRQFAGALATMEPHVRRAAILWLVDRYGGVTAREHAARAWARPGLEAGDEVGTHDAMSSR